MIFQLANIENWSYKKTNQYIEKLKMQGYKIFDKRVQGVSGYWDEDQLFILIKSTKDLVKIKQILGADLYITNASGISLESFNAFISRIEYRIEIVDGYL